MREIKTNASAGLSNKAVWNGREDGHEYKTVNQSPCDFLEFHHHSNHILFPNPDIFIFLGLFCCFGAHAANAS